MSLSFWQSTSAASIVSTPLHVGGLMIFGKFRLGEDWKIVGLQGDSPLSGGSQSQGDWAENFYKFCKNVMEKFLEIK